MKKRKLLFFNIHPIKQQPRFATVKMIRTKKRLDFDDTKEKDMTVAMRLKQSIVFFVKEKKKKTINRS